MENRSHIVKTHITVAPSGYGKIRKIARERSYPDSFSIYKSRLELNISSTELYRSPPKVPF
jgi:hypothetical protein